MTKSKLQRAALAALGLAIGPSYAALAADPLTVFKIADEWGTIQPAGPRTGVNGVRFWNAEGSNNGANSSTAPFRFRMADVKSQFDAQFGAGNWQVTGVNMVFSQSNAAFTHHGGVKLYWFENDALQITNGVDDAASAQPGFFAQYGVSPLRFDAAANVLQTKTATSSDPAAIFGNFSLVDTYTFFNSGSANGDGNAGDWPLDVLANKKPDNSYNLTDPTSPNIQIGSPNYGIAPPIVNPARPFRSDTLANFTTDTARTQSNLNLAPIAADLASGTDDLSFLLVPNDPALAATYKGNPFGGDYPARIYITAEQIPTAGNASWGVDADGNWSVGSNWQPSTAPNLTDSSATFGSVITAARTVTLDAPQTVGAISFDNANKYTISGTSTLTMAVSSGQASISVVSGSHDIVAPVALSNDTTITVTPAASTLLVSDLKPTTAAITKAGNGYLAVNNVRAGSLNVNAGTVLVLNSGSDAGTSKVGALSIAAGASLDLDDDDLVVGAGTTKSAIETLVRNGRNGGAWNGTGGITSTAARNLATTGVGVLSGAEYTSAGGTGNFSGQAYAAGDTLVKYTWNGDANLDGRVTFDDYVKIDTGFNTGLTGWLNGDFNYSGSVNFDDYVLIDVAFNQQNGTLGRAVDWISGDDRSTSGLDQAGVGQAIEHFNQFGASYAAAFLAAVPEPGTASVVAGAAVTLATRRRRRPAIG